ncbi:nucleotide exchange factor GrpE [Roseofilum casamattae]|uniref:Protein GrpE n=1 Tax=Roseofilum casamattae BLCC-M143 TaxID=3022442 RepID=A0ABT7BXC9_9CYAN|nr:nucleotide exchange factor GrpE [Roseofilum casamattae]MDJ1183853.1 nucleotide exchange factor GrpE [Roseofilum casamattae BLCC-M143]
MSDESKQVENPQSPAVEDSLHPETISPQPSTEPEGSVAAGMVEDASASPEESVESPEPAVEEIPVSDAAAANPEAVAADMGQAALLAEVLASKEMQLEALQQSHDEVKAQYQRLGADFDNFRKRTTKEKADLEEQIKCKTIQELLPVVDNFERARSQIKPQDDGEMNIHKSYQSVYKQLVDCLKRIGVSPMRAEGKEFDPNLHEAVMREPTAEHAEGTVMEELMRGYLLNDRVLRHAMVKVAAATEAVEAEDNPEEPGEESGES